MRHRHEGPGGPHDHEMHGPPHRRGRRGGRAQRGDVRLAVLAVLADGPLNGYQVMSEISERTNEAWKPSPGAVYPTIAALEDEGLVVITNDGGRRLITLTDAGREFVESQTTDDPFDAMKEQSKHHDLRTATKQFHAAVHAVAESGSDEQLDEALKIIDKAKRSMYLLLAGDER